MENTKQLVHEFIAASKLHHRAIENAVRGMKIHHSGHRLLVHLSRCDVMPSQKEIAARFEVSPAAVANNLKKLEKDGYITRTTDDGDTRCNRIAITEKGKAILDETKTLFEGVDEKMLEGLSQDERALLFSCLSRMKKNLTSFCEENKEDER
ncbi:MAG: MarR family transcriptional regulator [Clostridia bacterium]|nr:MarR family transcriptional regulator [Clostridia bacterium]